jgi:hypothetical protein
MVVIWFIDQFTTHNERKEQFHTSESKLMHVGWIGSSGYSVKVRSLDLQLIEDV